MTIGSDAKSDSSGSFPRPTSELNSISKLTPCSRSSTYYAAKRQVRTTVHRLDFGDGGSEGGFDFEFDREAL